MNLLRVFGFGKTNREPGAYTERPLRRSFLGMWLGRNRRRRDSGPMLIQGELELQHVRPLHSYTFRDDLALVERKRAVVIWETPPAEAPKDDQDVAWNRLRGRREKIVARE